MNKKILFLGLVLILSSFAYAQNPVLNQLTYQQGIQNPIMTLNPSSILYSQISQNADLSSFLSAGQTIQNPSSFLTQTLSSELYSNLDQDSMELLQSSSYFVDQAKDNENIKSYDINMDDDGVVNEGSVVYEKEEVNLNGLKPGEDNNYDCAKSDCAISIGKNTYTSVSSNSEFKLSDEGKLQSANLIVTNETEMFFGDRKYKVTPGTNVKYDLKKDDSGDEYYEVVIDSKSSDGVEFSFPSLDSEGNPLPTYDTRYKVKGEVTFTESGLALSEGAEITDLNLNYRAKNNGNNPLYIVNKRENIPNKNYILANENEFEFDAEKTEIGILSGNKWNIDVPSGEELGINIDTYGAGHLDKNTNELLNDKGSFNVKNCNYEVKLTENEIIEKTENDGTVEDPCISLKYTTKSGISRTVEGVQVCGVESEGSSGEETTSAFSKIISGYFSKDITGKPVADSLISETCTMGLVGAKSKCKDITYNNPDDIYCMDYYKDLKIKSGIDWESKNIYEEKCYTKKEYEDYKEYSKLDDKDLDTRFCLSSKDRQDSIGKGTKSLTIKFKDTSRNKEVACSSITEKNILTLRKKETEAENLCILGARGYLKSNEQETVQEQESQISVVKRVVPHYFANKGDLDTCGQFIDKSNNIYYILCYYEKINGEDRHIILDSMGNEFGYTFKSENVDWFFDNSNNQRNIWDEFQTTIDGQVINSDYIWFSEYDEVYKYYQPNQNYEDAMYTNLIKELEEKANIKLDLNQRSKINDLIKNKAGYKTLKELENRFGNIQDVVNKDNNIKLIEIDYDNSFKRSVSLYSDILWIAVGESSGKWHLCEGISYQSSANNLYELGVSETCNS